MGGVVEGGVSIADKTSPRRAAIEKVQGELRQEYDFREIRKRELEFLENGGDPLEFFKGRNTFSLSVQSTSFTGQNPDQFVSEAKGSFALTASPHGDSVESSGRLGANPCEPNCADNLMLFDAERALSEGDRNSSHPRQSDSVPSEKFSLVDRKQRTQEHGDSAAFCLPRKAYKRRNRSRPNRDGTRSSSTNVNLTCGSHGSSLPSLRGPTEVKELVSDAENQNISSKFSSKLTAPVDDTHQNIGLTESKQDLESAGRKAVESTTNLIGGVPTDTASNAIVFETAPNDQGNQQSSSGAVKAPTQLESDAPETIQAMEEVTSVVIEREPSVSAVNVENLSGSCHTNGFSSKKGEEMKNDAPNGSALKVLKGLDSASSCTQTSLTIDGNNANDKCTKIINADSDGKIRDETTVLNGTPVEGDEPVNRKKETEGVDSSILVNGKGENAIKTLSEEVVSQSEPALKNEEKDDDVDKGMETNESTGLEPGRKSSEVLGDKHGVYNKKSFDVRVQDSTDTPTPHHHDVVTVSLVPQKFSGSDPKFTREIDDDSILKEAQMIEAKRKRIMELAAANFPQQSRPKSHWDYVIEEMAWLANDFAQERVWKIAAAAQISSRAAFKCRSRLQDNSSGMVAKKAAHNLARSIVEFWQSVEEMSKVVKLKSPEDEAHTIQAYAMRFMNYNKCTIVYNEAEAPPTPDRLLDVGIPLWKDNLTEENLFYPVLPGAMETYINSIESYVSQCERIGSSIQEEVETSVCDATEDFASQDNAYDGDEGETNNYDGSKSIRYGQKKRKNLTHAYGMREYDVGSDTMVMKYGENKFVAQQSPLPAKRPGGSLNVSVPTKRVRTASRRVVSPFGSGIPGCVQVSTKQDASSGDNNSFQDDQGTPYGGSLVPNCLEVESYGNFEKQLPYDSAEVSTKHRKKKKAKHLNVAYEQRWQVDSTVQNEQFQRDHLRRNYQLDSNGGSGLFTQPSMKKPKSMRQSHDNSFENITPASGSVPSPAASQMSNMSSPNKFIKILGGRDRGRKTKVLKMPAGQPGSGSPWTLFEDQALVVLAHDLGMNWELVSDALNSTVYFKRTFRKAKECKERHNFLMEGTSADGADSAEDSGSSQHYSSTLPGIPKGSARQLFQRLQGPMEEETIKSHFEKIIIVGQRLHYHKSQDPKQLLQPHSSHTIALSQACQNNPDGVILTPLDLCDATIIGNDIPSIGYQGQHSGGLHPNQATTSQQHPTAGSSSLLQGSPNMVLGSHFSSTLGTLNASVRDGRYGVPRSASFSADDQQRVHQYNQMMSGRNIPQLSSPGALQGTDRGVRLLPGGSGMGLVCGVNRSAPMIRPTFQGVGSSSISNSGNMVSRGMTSASVNSGASSGQGSLMLRPREALNVMQPGLSQDQPQQMVGPDLQMQVSPRSSQGISHFGGLSSPFPKQTPSSMSSYSLHHQSPHPMSPQQPQVHSPHDPHVQAPGNQPPNPQQQPYAIRLAKERQQQRYLQQQQQKQLHQPQFAASGSMMSHVQSQSQLPMSSPLQNITQSQPQAGPLSPLASATPMNSVPQHQQKHPTPSQGVARNAQAGGSGLTNQTSKQRQRPQQQFSQANRQHPLQRQQQQQQQQSQQTPKVAKGVGRGNPMLHQNIPIDPTSENGVSTNLGNQSAEKGEGATHLMQSQGVYTGSTLNTVQLTKKFVSSQSSNQLLSQPKVYSGQAASSAKNINQLTSHPDNSSRNHVPASSVVAGSNHNQVPASQQKSENPNHPLQRAGQLNRQMSSDSLNKRLARDSDTDMPSLSTSSEIDKMTSFHSTTNSATNVVQVPPVGDHKWHASEPLLDSHASNSVVSLPSNASESTPQVSQALGQRLSSGSLASIRHDASAQWQQQPSKLQQPNSPVPQPQQNQQPLYSKQQAQLLQAGNDNLYHGAGEHRLE